ncbi:hypothetical protein GE061_014642 [Apolygus lucorum]|uniref:Uncharacterized protein n=1 Tax=Apolygus lucorum TaxID=248454 RepID=A0A8S9XIL5_APOLU|nr:hypothetical protein GE061_014642 [Apolygus lucorum]
MYSFKTRYFIEFLFAFAIGFELLIKGEGKKYIVATPGCRIPDYDPYDNSIDGIPEKWPPISCTSLPPLTTLTGLYQDGINNGRVNFTHVLHLHKHRFRHYKISQTNFACCYRLITRDNSNKLRPDNGYRLSSCIKFKKHVKFFGREEFIGVACANGNYSDQPPYTNLHAFVGFKPEVNRKIQSQRTNRTKLSVMIIGFDSISRLNMIRTMPTTVKHLRDTGWYEMKGFNKVGDNTFPNLMAAFSGLNLEQVTKSCQPRYDSHLDNCSIIWKKFSDNGYVTAYGEDQPVISTFNGLRTGFKVQPTDYYLRPFVLASHDHAETAQAEPEFQGRLDCYGPTKVVDHFFNYSLDFLQSFRGFPTFSILWQNGLGLEHVNSPSRLDESVLEHFERTAESGVLENTIILFMSDHGFRFDAIRQTFLGYLEERWPFLYIWVPKSFKRAYPDKINNLVSNGNRLTSPYDIYVTLTDVLGGKVKAPGCPMCKSFFEQMPWDRTCLDAGIPDQWCTCSEYTDIDSTSGQSRKMADLVLLTVNTFLRNNKNHVESGKACAFLSLNRVIYARKRMPSNAQQLLQMVVGVETYPGLAQFEGTTAYSSGSWKVKAGSIIRINRYGDQSRCVNNTEMKKYCYCL